MLDMKKELLNAELEENNSTKSMVKVIAIKVLVLLAVFATAKAINKVKNK